jgi:hypothetical protein
MRIVGPMHPLAVATVLGATGCSLSTSFSEFTADRRDASKEDGGTKDAGVPTSDLGRDAGAPPTTGRGFCAQKQVKPLFCADFDDGRPFDVGWSSTTLTYGGTLDVDPNAHVLRASTPAASDNGLAKAFLAFAIPRVSSHLHVEARLRPVALSGGILTPLSIEQTIDGVYRGLILYVGPTGMYVQEETADPSLRVTSYPIDSPVTLGEWHAFAFDLDFAPSGVSLEVRVDSISKVKVSVLAYPWQSKGLQLDAGLAYLLTKDPAVYELDEIVADER